MNADKPDFLTADELRASRDEKTKRPKSSGSYEWEASRETRRLQEAIDTLAKALEDDEDERHEFLVHSNRAMNALGRKNFIRAVGGTLRVHIDAPVHVDEVKVFVTREFFESKMGNAEWISRTLESHGYRSRVEEVDAEMCAICFAPIVAGLDKFHTIARTLPVPPVKAADPAFLVPPVPSAKPSPPASTEPEPDRTVRATLLARKARLERELRGGGGFMPCVMVGDGMGGQVDFRDRWKSDTSAEISRVDAEIRRLDAGGVTKSNSFLI